MLDTQAPSQIAAEIREIVRTTYSSLRTSAAQHGIALPAEPPEETYTSSPLIQHLQYLAGQPDDPTPSLRALAALLHGYPPVAIPLPLPDWFWERIPALARILVDSSNQWISITQAIQLTGLSYPTIGEACDAGILLSVYLPPRGHPTKNRRYIWRPDLVAQYPNAGSDSPAKRDPS